MLLTLNTSTSSIASDRVSLQTQAAGWIHAQTWVVEQRQRGTSDSKGRSSNRSKQPPKPVMEDRPPPVPPKDSRRSPPASPPLSRRRVPVPLQPTAYQQTDADNRNSFLTVRGQPGASYTSYTYPPGSNGAPVEPTSAPSTRTEFEDAVASTPTWHRPSELFLPYDAATPRAPATERCISPVESSRAPSSLRRSVSTYTAAEYSPSTYSPSVHSPPSAIDLSRAATLRSQSTWVGPSPISPPESREHWAQNSYPPARAENRQTSAWTPSEEPFDDASQFHLFAEATAGLGPLVEHGNGHKQQRNILSPVATRGNFSHQDSAFLTLGTHAPRALSVPPQLPQEYYAPRVVTSMHRRQTSNNQRRSREAQELTEAFAEALTGFGPEGHVGPEDELPDYAQSQREAQQRQRRAAAQRAQELEDRWAKARRAAQARGR